MSNFLLGGRLGDLIHALYVAKNTPGKHDMFITDRRDLHSDGFLLPLEETYEELYPIITTQPFCKSFKIYKDEDIENLSMWRRYAYSASWTQLLANTFNVPVNGESWMSWGKSRTFEEKIIIHSSPHPARAGHHWDIVLDMYKGRCVFLGTDEEYSSFGKDIPHQLPRNLMDYFTIINSCKFFIGNQSAPLAIAHSLAVPRLAMLNEVDKIHYVGEEKFCKDFYWVAKDSHYFPALNLES